MLNVSQTVIVCSVLDLYKITPSSNFCRSQWPRGLRRRSAAARLLRSWVRIPPGAWMFVVNVVCCQVDVSATGLSLIQRRPTACDASLCVIKKPRMRGKSPPRGCGKYNQKGCNAKKTNNKHESSNFIEVIAENCRSQ